MAYVFEKYSVGGGVSTDEVVQTVKDNFDGGIGYEESGVVELVPEQTITLDGPIWYSPSFINLVVGNTYTVNFNGTSYECVAAEGVIESTGNAIYLGSGAIVEGGSPTEEPFMIASVSTAGMSILFVFEEITEATLSVSGYSTVAHKIAPKFLDTIGKAGTGVNAEVFNGGAAENASGMLSHAEGGDTTASGMLSHAEGGGTTASGNNSHAEGGGTTASAEASHAEGGDTTASGMFSHAEGKSTTASGDCQHAQGKYNIEDTEDKYAHIVGNGDDDARRSNAHTLDWDGNAWFAGTVEGTAIILTSSTSGSSKRFKITVDDSGTLTATEIT